jgi:hypothetical protein
VGGKNFVSSFFFADDCHYRYHRPHEHVFHETVKPYISTLSDLSDFRLEPTFKNNALIWIIMHVFGWVGFFGTVQKSCIRIYIEGRIYKVYHYVLKQFCCGVISEEPLAKSPAASHSTPNKKIIREH